MAVAPGSLIRRAVVQLPGQIPDLNYHPEFTMTYEWILTDGQTVFYRMPSAPS